MVDEMLLYTGLYPSNTCILASGVCKLVASCDVTPCDLVGYRYQSSYREKTYCPKFGIQFHRIYITYTEILFYKYYFI